MGFNSIGEITASILGLEKKHDLLDLEIAGIKIYQLIRYKIYLQLIAKSFNSTYKSERSFFTKIKKLTSKLHRVKNYFFLNPFSDKTKSDILIFESGRKKENGGKYIDPFTDFVKRDLLKKKLNFTIYRNSYLYDSLAESGKNVKHLDYITLNTEIKSRLNKVKLSEADALKVKSLAELLQTSLGLESVEQLISAEITSFKFFSEYYSRLLDIKKPSEIFIVNFCDKAPLINEAKRRKIKVKDIQHGFISEKDIIYHYPDTPENKLEYFPDNFIAWSDLWMGNVKLPISSDNISYVENSLLCEEIQKYAYVKKNPKKLLFISQDSTGTDILKYILRNIDTLKNFDFYFKPHPNEYGYMSSIPEFNEAIEKKNFFVIDYLEDLYSHLADSAFVFGTYSTVMIEALYFNCKVYVMNLPGSEMFDYLIQQDKFKKINLDAELYLN